MKNTYSDVWSLRKFSRVIHSWHRAMATAHRLQSKAGPCCLKGKSMKLLLSYRSAAAQARSYISPRPYILLIFAVLQGFFGVFLPTNCDWPPFCWLKQTLKNKPYLKGRGKRLYCRHFSSMITWASLEDGGIIYSGNPFNAQVWWQHLWVAQLNLLRIASLLCLQDVV